MQRILRLRKRCRGLNRSIEFNHRSLASTVSVWSRSLQSMMMNLVLITYCSGRFLNILFHINQNRIHTEKIYTCYTKRRMFHMSTISNLHWWFFHLKSVLFSLFNKASHNCCSFSMQLLRLLHSAEFNRWEIFEENHLCVDGRNVSIVQLSETSSVFSKRKKKRTEKNLVIPPWRWASRLR